MKTMADNEEDVNYSTFLQHWVPLFIENGLDTNACAETETKKSKRLLMMTAIFQMLFV